MFEDISTDDLKNELNKRMAETSKVKPRYEITGEWSGYNSKQRRIVHREYVKNKDFAEKVKALGFVSYSDGTTLNLKVRQMSYGERKQSTINGYGSLIRSCIAKDTNDVSKIN